MEVELQDSKPIDNRIKDKLQERFEKNATRAQLEEVKKLRSINIPFPEFPNLRCRYCKKTDHVSADCTNVICFICKQKHPLSSCPFLRVCTWCGGDHPASICQSTEGIAARTMMFIRCPKCGRIGHLARLCNFKKGIKRNFRKPQIKRRISRKFRKRRRN